MAGPLVFPFSARLRRRHMAPVTGASIFATAFFLAGLSQVYFLPPLARALCFVACLPVALVGMSVVMWGPWSLGRLEKQILPTLSVQELEALLGAEDSLGGPGELSRCSVHQEYCRRTAGAASTEA